MDNELQKRDDAKKEKIALTFVKYFKPYRHDANSPLYEACLCDYHKYCHLSFKFSDTGSAKPGLCIYVDGEKSRAEFQTKFSRLTSDDGKFRFNTEHKARPTDEKGFITFYREGCDTLEQAFHEIVDPGTEKENWKSFSKNLLMKLNSSLWLSRAITRRRTWKAILWKN